MSERRATPADHARRFDAIFAEYGPPLARLAASYAGARGEQDDLLQEIMIAIWRALPAYRGDCSERTYVYRIAHNRAMSYLSRRRPTAASLNEQREIPAPMPTPEQAYSRGQASAHLAAAVAALPAGHREVVALTLEGLSYREIADVLGISRGAVKSTASRALAQLEQAMEAHR